MSYIFAIDKTGATRLDKLHQIFQLSSESFLKEFGYSNPSLCLDLGCGPGFTTRSVANILIPGKLIGLDNSQYFIDLAKRKSRKYSNILYETMDVNQSPFPFSGIDIIYLRFLLTHLQNPMKCLKHWGNSLQNGGLMMLEETQAI